MTLLITYHLSLITSCTTDSYETGEGEYSLMQADLAEVNVDGDKYVTSFVTDENSAYTLVPAVTAQWIQTADTVYRAIVYYNKVDDTHAEAQGIGSVPTLRPVEHWRFEQLPTDPIGLESMWLAKSGRYINLGLLVKTGRIADEELPHIIGLAQDTVLLNADQTRTAYYRFLHNQNGAPEYYSNRRYVSILLPEDRPDTVRLAIQTYDGMVEKSFCLSR